MTLDGTNTYLVGEPGSGEVAVVDPGPDDARHLAAVEEALAGPRTRAASPSSSRTARATTPRPRSPGGARFGATVAAADRAGRRTARAACWRRGSGCGWPAWCWTSSRPRATPRITWPSGCRPGAVLVGDHVLGRGTSVVTHPEGDLAAYLESLRRVHDLGPSALYCGHGPELTEDPTRGARLLPRAPRLAGGASCSTALADGARTVDEIVAVVYAAVPRHLWPAAAESTRATLAKLAAEGRGSRGRPSRWRLGSPTCRSSPARKSQHD